MLLTHVVKDSVSKAQTQSLDDPQNAQYPKGLIEARDSNIRTAF